MSIDIQSGIEIFYYALDCTDSNLKFVLKKIKNKLYKKGDSLAETHWISCPICKGKTRTKIRKDTEILNFPLFCPKCKHETIINVKQLKISIIKWPEIVTQSL